MNVQTERLENHEARLTVEVPQERYDAARNSAIKALSSRVNIPGFRKGKVPPSMVVKYVGEAYILEEVMEQLGQSVYKEALEAADLEPAASGSMDDFKLEPTVTFTFTVPLAPEAILGDYREIRLDYTEPTVGEKEVENELRAFQREFAEATPSDEPVALGDRITGDLHSFFVQPEADAETGEGETDVHERSEEPYVHRHGAVLDLREGDDEPLAPGFSAQMVGARVGETRVFRITIPESGENIPAEAAGKTIEFVVEVQKIEKVALPPIDDELAAKVSERYGWDEVEDVGTPEFDDMVEDLIEEAAEDQAEAEAEESAEVADEDESLSEGDATDEADDEEDFDEDEESSGRSLTLEEVKARVLETIQRRSAQEAREQYANQVLEKVIEGATVTYHESSIEQEIDDMVEDLKNRLQQNRLTLDLYLKSTGRTLEDVRNDYREPAVRFLRRSIIVREFARAENLAVTERDMQERLMTVFADLGAESVQQLGLLNNEQFAANMINNLMSQKIEERAIAIGKGEAPELDEIVDAEPQAEEASPQEENVTETQAD